MSGTPIINTTATVPANSGANICDFSGFKAKRGELVETWDGFMVLPQYVDIRNPQDFVRSKPENRRGAVSPEPSSVNYITTAVLASDL